MSRLRVLSLLTAVLALAVFAGCGSDDDSEDSDSETAATVSLDDCTPDQLETLESGTLTVGTDKPAFPPYFEENDPTNGKGFESATAYAIAAQLGFDPSRCRVGGRPFQRLLRAGAQGLRLRRQPDLDHPEARRAGRLLVALLRGRAGGRRAQGLRRRQRDLAHRPRRRQLRSSDRDHQPRRGQRGDPAQQRAAGVRHLQRRRQRAQERAGRRGRRRRARPPSSSQPSRSRRRPRSGSSRPRAATSGGRCSRRTPRSPTASRPRSRSSTPPASCRRSRSSG